MGIYSPRPLPGYAIDEGRQKPEKISHIDSLGLYWDESDHHIKNVYL